MTTERMQGWMIFFCPMVEVALKTLHEGKIGHIYVATKLEEIDRDNMAVNLLLFIKTSFPVNIFPTPQQCRAFVELLYNVAAEILTEIITDTPSVDRLFRALKRHWKKYSPERPVTLEPSKVDLYTE